METSIGGILVAGVLLAAVVLTTRFATFSTTVTGSAIKDAAHLSGERLRTSIDHMYTTSSGSSLKLHLRNTGSVAISDYDEMDFVVDYIQTPGGGTRVITRLTYQTGSTPSNSRWVVSSNVSDSFQPGIWNPGEQIILEAKLIGPPKNGTAATYAVGTPNAVVLTRSFTIA